MSTSDRTCPFAVPDFMKDKKATDEKKPAETTPTKEDDKKTWSSWFNDLTWKAFWAYLGWSADKDKKNDDKSKANNKTKRAFPWKAAGGLALVALLGIASVWLSLSLVFKYISVIFTILGYVLKGISAVLTLVLGGPLALLASLIPSLSPSGSSSSKLGTSSYTYSPLAPAALTCNNSLPLQAWEVLTLVPGPTGNPAPHTYTLNAPTPHAVSFVDLDFRDTRLDVFADGAYRGSTSDFEMSKEVWCGEDVNQCIGAGFSMGTVLVPAGMKHVEIVWSGKDVFPGTDKIVWGPERKRRVMWKKDLCLQ